MKKYETEQEQQALIDAVTHVTAPLGVTISKLHEDHIDGYTAVSILVPQAIEQFNKMPEANRAEVYAGVAVFLARAADRATGRQTLSELLKRAGGIPC